MKYSEKLSAVLSLTATKNIALAKALNIDTAQISRMRTGARKMPMNPNMVREIAEYLSGRFDSEYKLSALYELTGDIRLQSNADEVTKTDVLYDWLIAPDQVAENTAEHFIGQFGHFSVQDLAERLPDSGAEQSALTNGGFAAYYKNDGKRQAVKDFFCCVEALDKPCTVKLFTDESWDWLSESAAFSRDLSQSIFKLAQRGFRLQRIQPPTQSTESAIRAIERWMPAYMSGMIKTFYYPWTRDELHRHTIMVAPGYLALYAGSLYGDRQSQMTFLCADGSTVAAVDEYFSGILSRCRPMMSVYADNEDKLLERLCALAEIQDTGIYKSARLSAHTLPGSAMAPIRRRSSPFVQKVLDTYKNTERDLIDTLRNHVITDIMNLPDLNNVLAHAEPVPGTKTSGNDRLFYTPAEYRLHLKHIIWYLDTFPNYRVALTDAPIQDDVVIYTKGDEYALMIKESEPYTLFEITEHNFASSLYSYLSNIVAAKSRYRERKEVIDRLNKEVALLDEATANT